MEKIRKKLRLTINGREKTVTNNGYPSITGSGKRTKPNAPPSTAGSQPLGTKRKKTNHSFIKII